MTKAELHALIDELPDDLADEAARRLDELRDPCSACTAPPRSMTRNEASASGAHWRWLALRPDEAKRSVADATRGAVTPGVLHQYVIHLHSMTPTRSSGANGRGTPGLPPPLDIMRLIWYTCSTDEHHDTKRTTRDHDHDNRRTDGARDRPRPR